VTPEQEKEVERAFERIEAMDDDQRARLFDMLHDFFCSKCGAGFPRCSHE
jgi:hypothetical protein